MDAQGMPEAERSASSGTDETGEAAAAPARTRLTVALILGAGVLVSGLIAGGTAYVVTGGAATPSASPTSPSPRPSPSRSAKYHDVENLCDYVDWSPLGAKTSDRGPAAMPDDIPRDLGLSCQVNLRPRSGAAAKPGIVTTLEVVNAIASDADAAAADFAERRRTLAQDGATDVPGVGERAFSYRVEFLVEAPDGSHTGGLELTSLYVLDGNLVMTVNYGPTAKSVAAREKAIRDLSGVAVRTLKKLAEA